MKKKRGEKKKGGAWEDSKEVAVSVWLPEVSTECFPSRKHSFWSWGKNM